MGLLFWAVTIGAGGVFLDYDSTAVWGLRLDAAVRDAANGGDTFTNPDRLAPMLRHPYFYTSLERGFSPGALPSHSSARFVPPVALYVSYLAVAWCAAGWIPDRRRRVLALVALLFLPAASLHLSVESPRETVMGFLGFFSVYCLSRWAAERCGEWALLAALFALAMQQTKVEGLPFVIGVLGALVIPAFRESGGRRLQRWRAIGLAVILFAATNLLWLYARARIPITRHSYDVTTALATDLPARLRALPGVLWMLCSELFLRPEIYGLTAFITAGTLLTGWRRGTRLMRFSLMLPSLLCIAGLIAVYAARQSYLPSERNVSFSRRIIVFLPALAFAALYVPPRREDEQCADKIEAAPRPDPVSS
jgi:hypothetical protein